jgi:hypothetical protein
MLAQIAEVYHRYGFDPLETSAVETVEALGKFLPDVDRPNEGVFAWQEDGDWLALRYDLTAPLARVAPSTATTCRRPYRRYADGPGLAQRKAGAGAVPPVLSMRCRHGGRGLVAADAEICAMLADTLEAVGIPRGDYIVRVNNRKVLNGVLEVAGLSGDDKDRTSAASCCAPSTSSTGWGGRACASCWARAARTRAAISRRARGWRRAGRHGDGLGRAKRDDGPGDLRAACASWSRVAHRRRGVSPSLNRSPTCSPPRATAPTASSSTPPSCAASATTPARSTRPN